jgi:hypothetical protein
MVETRLTRATRCKESQIDTERSDDRFCMGGPTAANLIQDDLSHRGCIVLASVGAERR